MVFYKLLIFMAYAAVAQCEDCVFNMRHKLKDIQFDLTSFKEQQTVNYTRLLEFYSINIQLCNSNKQKSSCDGIKSKVCLKNEKNELADIGSKIKEVKMDVNDQLIISLEGISTCKTNQKYATDMKFICNKTATENQIIYKSDVGSCHSVIELTSVASCPVDDLDIRRICTDIIIPHYQYKLDLNPLRRADNYLVESQNHRFEINICGRLNDNNKCGGDITTICDITNFTNAKVYAVGSKTDQFSFDHENRSLKLVQYEKATKRKRGRRIEFIFTCNEDIPPEKTKPEFITKHKHTLHDNNVAYFNVATSLVCIPRMACEIFTTNDCINLKPLHKRIGNLKVTNEIAGGYFYLNVCDYLNEYGEKMPASCTDGKTSVCYVDRSGEGIPIGSTQIGPHYEGNSILLKYTEGVNCYNSIKWSTMINFTCSDESQLVHDSTNLTSCTYIFKWKSPKACKTLFKRNNQCMAINAMYTGTVYNISGLKNQTFKVNDNENNAQFRFSVCSPLQIPCNDNFDSSACWIINGIEKNIGLFTDQVVFDNGKIYMSMEGDKCVHNGPNSYTTIRFICDYLDSKFIDYKQDLIECIFEFTIYTKHVCTTPALKVNCTVNDELGNIYDLSKLTKFDSNYEISISQKKTIILNVCHPVINTGYTIDNHIDGINCEFHSGVCLIDTKNLLIFDRYKNVGDVNKSPYKNGSKIILEMIDGYDNGISIFSTIEFTCSKYESNGPVLINEKTNRYIFQWFTPLACPSSMQIQKAELTVTINPTYQISHGLNNYSTHICFKNNTDANCNIVTSDLNYSSKQGRSIILTTNEKKRKYKLSQSNSFVLNTDTICKTEKNQNEKIIFKFVCGFEFQKPQIFKNKTPCVTNVLNIDPEICEIKLECRVDLYDLTPINGNHVVIYEKTKYYINICIPGKDGIGGIMESNGKNYSIGYQVQSPKSESKGIVEVGFTDGDICNNSIMTRYSTKIVLECDDSESLGEPIFMKFNEQCNLQFSWKTNLVCNKLIEFDKSTCTATINKYKNIIQVDLQNISLIINGFLDLVESTILYRVDFCNESVCLNNSKCFESMSLHYNDYNRQWIASFKNPDDFTKVLIIIKCTEDKPEDNIPEVESINDGVIISIYSKYVCCMYNSTNKEMCKKYLTQISTTTNTVKYELSIYPQSDLEITVDLENQIKKSSPSTENICVQHTKKAVTVNVTDISMEKKMFSTFIFSGIIIFFGSVLTFLVWIYRWKLLKEIRILFYTSSLTRIMRGNFQRDHDL